MSLARYVVQRCYDLEDSPRYKRVKSFVYDLLENPRAPVRPYFDVFMILLVLSSVYLLIYEVRRDMGAFGIAFEAVAVSIFLTEYLLRIWIYNDVHRIVINHYERAQFVGQQFRLWPPLREIAASKWDYMTTPLAVIDLLAIIPSYRPLRFLRLFLLFRLFKLFRYASSINEFVKVLSEKRFELYTLGIFTAFIVFTAASAIFFFEARGEGGEIDDFFDGIYWAIVTLSTVGYGDITPQTPEGRVITLILIMTGIGVIAFITSVIVNAFSEKMGELRDNRVFAELEKMKGGHTIICGFGRMGKVVADQLAAEKKHFVVIEPDVTGAEQAKHLGYLVIAGNAEKNELLERAGVGDRAERILCLTGSDVTNVYITLSARYLDAGIEIISRANQEESVRKLKQAGADHTVSPYKIVGLIAGEFIGKPVAFEAIHGILSGKEKIGLDAVTVRNDSMLNGSSVGEIDFRGNKLLLFGVISHKARKAEESRIPYELKARSLYFNPKPDFQLLADDVLLVFGHEYSVVHFKDRMESGKL
jgi:voltage-gated potassium channel